MDQKKILVTDDDPDFVSAVRIVLEYEGYLVEEASSGEECLAKMHADLPDLVLMDVMMSNPLDGYHTVQQISDDPRLRCVPILMLSSILDTQYVADFPTDQSLQIVDFLSKPIKPDALLANVRKWVKS